MVVKKEIPNRFSPNTRIRGGLVGNVGTLRLIPYLS